MGNGKKSNKNVTKVHDVSGSVSPNVTQDSKTELLSGVPSHLNTKKKWFQQSVLIGWKFNHAVVLLQLLVSAQEILSKDDNVNATRIWIQLISSVLPLHKAKLLPVVLLSRKPFSELLMLPMLLFQHSIQDQA